MDEENEKKDKGLIDKLKQGHKKANISKFKMLLRGLMAAPVVVKLALIVIIIAVISSIFGALVYIFDLEGSSNVSEEATEVIIKDMTNIVEAENGEGYYFRIDQKAKEKYLEELNRAFHEGYWYDKNPDDRDDEDFIYDPKDPNINEDYVAGWFKTRDYEKFLIKMLRAEVASSYPKLGDYYGDDTTDDGYGNLKDNNR